MGRLVKNPKINPGALAVQIPTVTTGQRPTGANGDIIYNSTTGTFQMPMTMGGVMCPQALLHQALLLLTLSKEMAPHYSFWKWFRKFYRWIHSGYI
jgi:hypothetical protein